MLRRSWKESWIPECSRNNEHNSRTRKPKYILQFNQEFTIPPKKLRPFSVACRGPLNTLTTFCQLLLSLAKLRKEDEGGPATANQVKRSCEQPHLWWSGSVPAWFFPDLPDLATTTATALQGLDFSSNIGKHCRDNVRHCIMSGNFCLEARS